MHKHTKVQQNRSGTSWLRWLLIIQQVFRRRRYIVATRSIPNVGDI